MASKLSRSETVTVRLDPRLQYLASIAARIQRRPLSSYIEWAVQKSLEDVAIFAGDSTHDPITIAQVAVDLWDVDGPDRFIKLAFRFPDVLNHEEQTLWKLIREAPGLWKGYYDNNYDPPRWIHEVREERVSWKTLRPKWQVLRSIAKGEADRNVLPAFVWNDRKVIQPPPPPPELASPANDSEATSGGEVAPMDDEDIPF